MNQVLIEKSSRLLNEAVKQKDVDMVRTLLQSGVNVNARADDEPGNGILYNSILAGSDEITELLLQYGARVEDVNDDGFTALDMAMILGRAEQLNILLKRGAKVHINTFHYLIKKKNRRRYLNLMYQLVDWSERDKDGMNIVHLAAKYDHNVRGLRMLIARGAMLDERTLQDGQTALHLASWVLKYEYVERLLAMGVPVDLKDEFGFTALHKAVTWITKRNCQSDERYYTLHLLLAAGSPVNEVAPDGASALLIAARNGDAFSMEILLEYGADVNLKDDTGATPLYAVASCKNNFRLSEFAHLNCLRTLLAAKADVNEPNNEGIMPLHVFALRAQSQCVRMLLDHGAKANSTDMHGFTPLHLVSGSTIRHIDKIDQIKVVRYLLDAGASVNHVANNGKTPLQCAADANYTEIVELMIRHIASYWCGKKQKFLPRGEPNGINAELIEENQKWKNYLYYCKGEVEKMQTKMWVDEWSYRDILIRDPRIFTRYAKNFHKIFMFDFQGNPNKDMFPRYYYDLQHRLRIVSDMRILQDRASFAFSELVDIVDPRSIVTEHILSYLDSRDLDNVVDAAML